MKTTLELPDELMRDLRIRAAQTDRKLKDVVAELIPPGLENTPTPPIGDLLHTWVNKLVVHADGTVTNPDGIGDSASFEALEDIRDVSRREKPRDPFADVV